MHLRPITIGDLPLYERVLTSAEMMAELGGPLPREGMQVKLEAVVADVEDGAAWFDVIETDEGEAAGWVCTWSHAPRGEQISEMGWMVLPEMQGRGLAGAVVRAHLGWARAEGRWGVIHAYPAVTNGPSNAICRKAGFSLLGELEIEYAGRRILANDWRIDVSEPDGS